MIPNIGIGEMAVVLVIALIVLGPQKLPSAARAAGRGFREFRSALSGLDVSSDEKSSAERDPASPS